MNHNSCYLKFTSQIHPSNQIAQSKHNLISFGCNSWSLIRPLMMYGHKIEIHPIYLLSFFFLINLSLNYHLKIERDKRDFGGHPTLKSPKKSAKIFSHLYLWSCKDKFTLPKFREERESDYEKPFFCVEIILERWVFGNLYLLFKILLKKIYIIYS